MNRLLLPALALSFLACRGRGRPPDRLSQVDAGGIAAVGAEADPAPVVEAQPASAPEPRPGPRPPRPTATRQAPPDARPAVKPRAAAETRAAAESRAAAPASGAPATLAMAAATSAAAPTPDAGARPDGATRPIVVASDEAAGAAAEAAGPSPSDLVAGPRRLKRSRASAAAAPLPIPGGPLPIPAGKGDLDTVRVERFAETGGTTLEGRLQDVDSRQPVAGANIEAWMDTRSIHAQSDADGRFRFEGLVPKSNITLWITAAPTFVQERIDLPVPAGDRLQTSFQLLPRSAGTGTRESGVGLFLSRRGARTVVTGLTAFGPAERAGIQIGEALVAVGKRDVTALGPGAIDFLLKGPMGSEVTLTVQAGRAAPRTLTLKRSGR